MLSWKQGVENTTLQIPDKSQKCCRTGRNQSFLEASLLSKPAATEQAQVQRLGTKNKGGFSYIPFRAGYRNGGAMQLVPYIITCYFIGCFNLWGKVTLLWSLGNILQLWFFFVSL
jgi:hypothetical protein